MYGVFEEHTDKKLNVNAVICFLQLVLSMSQVETT